MTVRDFDIDRMRDLPERHTTARMVPVGIGSRGGRPETIFTGRAA